MTRHLDPIHVLRPAETACVFDADHVVPRLRRNEEHRRIEQVFSRQCFVTRPVAALGQRGVVGNDERLRVGRGVDTTNGDPGVDGPAERATVDTDVEPLSFACMEPPFVAFAIAGQDAVERHGGGRHGCIVVDGFDDISM